MNPSTIQQRKKLKRTEKSFQKRYYSYFIILSIFGIVYYFFLQPTTIGKSTTYNIYIFWIPVILGVCIFAIYRRSFLLNNFRKNKGFVLWSFMILYYLAQGFIFSYLSFGQVASITWDIINKEMARKNPIQLISCDIRGYKGYSRQARFNTIYFTFEEKKLSLNATSEDIRPLRNQNYKNFKIELEVQKGIWEHYLLHSYNLVEK